MDPVIGTVIVSLFTIIPSMFVAFLAYRTAREGRDEARLGNAAATQAVALGEENKQQLKVIHTLTDGLMTKYITDAKALARAEGVVQGAADAGATAASVAEGLRQARAGVASAPLPDQPAVVAGVSAVSGLTVVGTVPVTGSVEVSGVVTQSPTDGGG